MVYFSLQTDSLCLVSVGPDPLRLLKYEKYDIKINKKHACTCHFIAAHYFHGSFIHLISVNL